MTGYVRREFELNYPYIADKMTDCRETKYGEYIIRTSEGKTYLYDSIGSQLRILPDDICTMSDQEYAKEFSARLRRMLIRRGVSQLMLSKRTGISNVTVSNYVRGKKVPSLPNLARIAKALNCAMDDLTYI